MRVFIFSTIFVWNISQSKKNWARCDKKNLYWSSYEVPVSIVWFYWNLNFLDSFSKNNQI